MAYVSILTADKHVRRYFGDRFIIFLATVHFFNVTDYWWKNIFVAMNQFGKLGLRNAQHSFNAQRAQHNEWQWITVLQIKWDIHLVMKNGCTLPFVLAHSVVLLHFLFFIIFSVCFYWVPWYYIILATVDEFVEALAVLGNEKSDNNCENWMLNQWESWSLAFTFAHCQFIPHQIFWPHV